MHISNKLFIIEWFFKLANNWIMIQLMWGGEKRKSQMFINSCICDCYMARAEV